MKPWLPTSWPWAAMARTSSGARLAHRPVGKKVTWMPSRSKRASMAGKTSSPQSTLTAKATQGFWVGTR